MVWWIKLKCRNLQWIGKLSKEVSSLVINQKGCKHCNHACRFLCKNGTYMGVTVLVAGAPGAVASRTCSGLPSVAVFSLFHDPLYSR